MKTKSKSKLKRDVELLFEIGTLRSLDRVWHQFLNPDVANCAEHIFRVAWIALTISRYEKIGNHEKILKMALAHDVLESRTGDVHYLSRQYTKRDETLAAQDIFDGTIHENDFIHLLHEYEKRKTIESKIVKDADILDVELELREQRDKGHSVGTIWVQTRKKGVYPTLFTKTARKLCKEIADADPHSWHRYSPRNRHNAGDWKRTKKK